MTTPSPIKAKDIPSFLSYVFFLVLQVTNYLSQTSLQPVGVLYRPPDSKMKNVKTRDYMGTAVSFYTSVSDSLFLLTLFTYVLASCRIINRRRCLYSLYGCHASCPRVRTYRRAYRPRSTRSPTSHTRCNYRWCSYWRWRWRIISRSFRTTSQHHHQRRFSDQSR